MDEPVDEVERPLVCSLVSGDTAVFGFAHRTGRAGCNGFLRGLFLRLSGAPCGFEFILLAGEFFLTGFAFPPFRRRLRFLFGPVRYVERS